MNLAHSYASEVFKLRNRKMDPNVITVLFQRISYYEDVLKIPSSLYQIAADAYINEVSLLSNEILIKIAPGYYRTAANWSWRAGNYSQAITAIGKAIDLLKQQRPLDGVKVREYEKEFKKYQVGK